MSLDWDVQCLSHAYTGLMFFNRKTTEAKSHFHHIKSRVYTMRTWLICWQGPWSPAECLAGLTVKWPSLPSWLYRTLWNKVTLRSLNLKSRELNSTGDWIYKNCGDLLQIFLIFFNHFSIILAWTHEYTLVKNRIGYKSIMFYTVALTFPHHCGNYDCLQSDVVRYTRLILYVHSQNQLSPRSPSSFHWRWH